MRRSHPKDKYFFTVNGKLIHKSPIKVWLNPILRRIQFYTNKPYVITSITEWKQDGTPTFVKYAIRQVLVP